MKKFNENNLILKSDSYKYCMYSLYPSNSTNLFSYLESRGGVYQTTVFFGLQYLLKKYLLNPITVDDVEEAKEFMAAHGVAFNYDGWMRIAKLGYLPVRIRAVPEGLNVPVSNALLTIESTDPESFWLVNFLETLLLKVWYSTTVATQSHYIKKDIYESLVKTADNADAEIDFKLHSFGYRGVSSEESAAIGGAAELTQFKGTDTLAGIICANNYYDAGMCGFSINASEHSTICSWGRENEVGAFKNMINKYGTKGSLFACVSDSWDIFSAITDLWGGKLKDQLIESGATLVIRPDSGEPTEIVPKCLKLMEEKFGYTLNSKGYKVINHVKLIQGDGCNPKSIKRILDVVNNIGYSTTNLAFGMGGASIQGSQANTINRDTQKFAFKASSITFDGEERDCYKDPVTDSGKRSKRGRLDLVCKDGQYSTVRLDKGQISTENSVMRTVYENGQLLVEEDFETIKNRSKQ
jgi:nicotinamide phosphoribosyltransferase